ncbi:uncharacterized protein YcnI [Virgibacillus halotolerans]|uniref:YcnI family copper-binding membrane protein n=1 Tax=Virgibacillus halotolerans TaxID=1071053 RepID=UPI001EF95176|nr:YcnI family protein [Virgibacillus halotolerans]MBM7599611.1 uncharacterized protein YcnI [Virgibacillus halotolerans]
MFNMRIGMSLLFAIGLLFSVATVAEAHVTVNPSESTTNAYEKYTIRMPVEKDVNTTGLELEVPDGVDLVSVLPMESWDYELEEDDDGRITSVVWTAKDGGIKPNEFIEISFIGANPSEPTEVSWKALQTYEDDSVVEWVGAPDSDEPASVTEIVEGDTVAPHGHGADHEDSEADEPTQKSEDDAASTSSNWIPISIASLALLLALISLLRKRS